MKRSINGLLAVAFISLVCAGFWWSETVVIDRPLAADAEQVRYKSSKQTITRAETAVAASQPVATPGKSMSSSGPNNPTTAHEDTGTGTVAWSSYTTTPAVTVASESSYYCVFDGFGFSIPSGATIDGIEGSITRRTTSGTVITNRIRIVKGGTVSTTELGAGDSWPGSYAAITIGGASDLCGETWTDSDINASTFGVAVSAAGLGTGDISSVSLTVHYTGGTPAWYLDGYVAQTKSFGLNGELLSMLKNTAGQKIGGQMITAADGTDFSSTVTVYITGDAGTQAVGTVGSGICTNEGRGYFTYAPSQAETNYDLIGFTFAGTGAITNTVQVATQTTASTPPTVSAIADEVQTRTIAAVTVVNGLANNTITANSIASNAITAAKVATDAIGAAQLAADAVTEIQSGLATPTNITAGTITTVTNLTNAPTAGDFTATMKTSLNAATPAIVLSAADSMVLSSGTATAGGNKTITLQTALGADNMGIGCKIKITSGTGALQMRRVAGYVNSTKVVTVDRAWTTNPDATSVYTVVYDSDVGATVCRYGAAFTSSAGTTLKISAWLERDGQAVVLTSGSCTVTYRENASGSDLFTVTDAAPNAQGIFELSQTSPGFTSDRLQVASVEITVGNDTWTTREPVPVFG